MEWGLCTSKEVGDGHAPEVDGSGGEFRIELSDEELELASKGARAQRHTTGTQPEGQRWIRGVWAEVGANSLLEELNVGEELRWQRQVGGIGASHLFLAHLHDHFIFIPLEVVSIEVDKDLLPQTTSKIEHQAHEHPLHDKSFLPSQLL